MALDSSRDLQHLLPMHSMNVGVLEEASNITSSWPVASAATACTSGFACLEVVVLWLHRCRMQSLWAQALTYCLCLQAGISLEVGPGAGILGG